MDELTTGTRRAPARARGGAARPGEAARLQQANIVPVLSTGSSGSLPYYTMPFVTGESLRARLASGTRLTVSQAVSILRDVARALSYAHAQGVVHRDIKPENILLHDGSALVADFGIALAVRPGHDAPGEDEFAGEETGHVGWA